MWQFAPNSVYYLLNMWQKMVASCPFVKANEPHYLDRFTPEVPITCLRTLLCLIVGEGGISRGGGCVSRFS